MKGFDIGPFLWDHLGSLIILGIVIAALGLFFLGVWVGSYKGQAETEINEEEEAVELILDSQEMMLDIKLEMVH